MNIYIYIGFLSCCAFNISAFQNNVQELIEKGKDVKKSKTVPISRLEEAIKTIDQNELSRILERYLNG